MRTQMKVFKDVKKIANKMSQIRQLVKKLEGNPHFDVDGLEWESVEFIKRVCREVERKSYKQLL